jgi:hypothetical protein
MTSVKQILLVIGSTIVVIALACACFVAMLYFSMVSTVMTKRSPDRLHTAKLTRCDGIDRIFSVTVDGVRVYDSPDFAPGPVDCREQLIWDTDSTAVVLEVAGRRLFGYHAGEKRALKDSELYSLRLTPFHELGFEGQVPEQVVAE